MPHLNFSRVTQYLAKIALDVVISLTFVNHSSGKIGMWGMGHGALGIETILDFGFAILDCI